MRTDDKLCSMAEYITLLSCYLQQHFELTAESSLICDTMTLMPL